VSTIVVFGLLITLVVTAPGWPEVREQFFDGEIFSDAFPEIAPKIAVLTIPMARLTDWLIARERRRRLAGSAV
jgi:hypothetical protein